MRKPIMVDWSAPMTVHLRLDPNIRAYVYGSVANETANEKSDLDVYVVGGPAAERIEARYMLERPLIIYKDRVYPLHVIGPATIDEETFLKAQPEAMRIL